MNMISQLRQRVSENGEATISLDEYNQLQAEWTTRAGIEALPPVTFDNFDYETDHDIGN